MTAAVDLQSTRLQSSQARNLMVTYVGTMLLSASLLFLVQPMFARMALPLLGGTPAVWAIAMCFFQGVLLGGYAYAHLLKKYLSPRTAVMVHVALMAAAWLTLPVSITASEIPSAGSAVGIWLVWMMAKSIGYPFFLLSATAPLLQSWFARTTHQDSENPYFLYSASNIGSLGSLIAYPFVIEPILGLTKQSQLWSVGYGALTLAIAFCGLMMLRNAKAADVSAVDAPVTKIAASQKLWWIFMAFVPSALLVAWTNHITTDIASAPFLWLPPLVLFLLTFVLVFRDKPLIPTWLARILQLVSLPVAFIVQFALPLWLAVPVMLIGAVSFFMTAIICHRQLYESRPDAGNLTEFYMLMSLGGVMGGLFVSLLAPLVFSTVLEYPILLLLGVIAYRPVWTDAALRSQLRMPILPLAVFACLALYFINLAPMAMKIDVPVMRALELAFFGASAAVFIRAKRVGLAILCMIMLFLITLLNLPEPRVNYRSYFGVSSVIDNGFDGPYRMLNHGTTMHGAQRLSELAEDFKGRPNAMTYFSRVGGIARSVIATQDRLAAEGKKGVFRVIGLGTGSLSCYSQEGEDWAFYEIDHDVVRVASDPNQFTFLSRCAPNMPIIEGDARITLQKGPIEKSDYFLVDAFSSDSIPVHLITVEAMKMYFERINTDGVVTMHITNRYMDLAPVVAANLKEIDPSIQARIIDFTPPKKENGRPDLEAMHSIAIVMSRNPKNFEKLDKDVDVKPLVLNPEVTAWTDDFADIPSSIMRRLGITKY